MTQLTQDIFNQITQLPEPDREALLEMVKEWKVNQDSFHLSQEWEEEIERRLVLADQGQNPGVPLQEALARP